jgi:hypothetical protein
MQTKEGEAARRRKEITIRNQPTVGPSSTEEMVSSLRLIPGPGWVPIASLADSSTADDKLIDDMD